MFRRRPFIFGIGIAPNATGALTASAAVGRRAGCSSLSLPRPIARRLAARGMLRPTRAQRKRRRIVRFAVGSLGFGRRPFSCARWQRCHIRNAPFVLTQYGWFSLSQRSDAKSPGAEAPGLLFASGRDATVSRVRSSQWNRSPRTTFSRRTLGASPVAVRNPGPEKSYEAPDNFPAPGLLHVSPVVTGASASDGALCYMPKR